MPRRKFWIARFREEPTIHENVWERVLDWISRDLKKVLKECIPSLLELVKVKIVLYEDYKQIENGAVTDFYIA